MLLTCLGACLSALSRLPISIDLSAAFALYGALHAAALVLALKARASIARKGLFVLGAAALSLATFRLGLFAGRLWAAPLGAVAPYAVLGLSGAMGAALYGSLIRSFGFLALTARPLAGIAAGCMLASCAALFSQRQLHSLGSWWLAVLWWYAFSMGLWCADRAQRSAPGVPVA